MKKFATMALVLALSLCALALPVNAAETADVHVYLDAPAQVLANDEVAVSLYVNGTAAAGGLQGTITYDTEKLEYLGVTLREDVTKLGNSEDVTIKADGSGTVKFVTLSNVAGGASPANDWLAVNFRVKMADAGANTAVTLSDVVVSDTEGNERLTATTADTTVKLMVMGVNDHMDLNGATIRTSLENQGIRFESAVDMTAVDPATVTEVGVVMFPTALLYEGQDLTKDTVGKGGTVPAVAKITADEDADKLALVRGGEKLYATLTNGTTGGRANVAITARAYMVVNGETIYSFNDGAQTGIAQGAASKSLVSVAQAIAAAEIQNGNLENTLGDVLTKTETLTDDEVITLLTFCRENIAYLQA